MSIKLSYIELGPVANGKTGADAVKNIVETAQKAEELGFNRVWLAEHHNTANFISRAPEVTIPLVASNTSKIRVGSGSVLLNHYSPYKVAEVFALQRNRSIQQNSEDSEEQLKELLNWLTNGL